MTNSIKKSLLLLMAFSMFGSLEVAGSNLSTIKEETIAPNSGSDADSEFSDDESPTEQQLRALQKEAERAEWVAGLPNTEEIQSWFAAVRENNQVKMKQMVDGNNEIINAFEPVTGNQALHYFAQNGDSEMVMCLLRNGAGKNETNESGMTASKLACLYSYNHLALDILYFSEENGADITAATQAQLPLPSALVQQQPATNTLRRIAPYAAATVAVAVGFEAWRRDWHAKAWSFTKRVAGPYVEQASSALAQFAKASLPAQLKR